MERNLMLRQHLDAVFYGEAWHGAALLPTIRTFGPAEAVQENNEGYSPWQIVLHCAYWKFFVRRAISSDGASLSFPRQPDDFPDLPAERTQAAWQADIDFLATEHKLLVGAVQRLPDDRLAEIHPQERLTYAGLILGAASHDVYHTAHLRNLGVRTFK
jgi:hypothetical protein